jgi:hypothetical protein
MYSVSVHDPRLYLHLDLRRNMDNPPRHTCLPWFIFFCLKLGLLVCCLPVLFVFGHRFRVEDYCLAVYCEVGSIPKGLLRGQGRIHFYLGLFSFLLFLGEGKGTGEARRSANS